MSPAAKEFEKLLLGRQLAHGGNPVLAWMASNVAIRCDAADNIKPDKAKSRNRIDGIVALVMAAGRVRVQSEFLNVYGRGRSRRSERQINGWCPPTSTMGRGGQPLHR